MLMAAHVRSPLTVLSPLLIAKERQVPFKDDFERPEQLAAIIARRFLKAWEHLFIEVVSLRDRFGDLDGEAA